MVGEKIIICPSQELSDSKLTGLVNRKGTIVEELIYKERKNKGYMVRLSINFMGETIWFIPFSSIKKI